jgi:glycosyltransferase involved in cell wall biosynthesis
VLRLISRLNLGGPAKHVAWLMQGMDRERFDQLLAAGRVARGEDDLGPALAARGLAWEDLPALGRALHPVRDLAALGRVLGLMIRHRPHIVATHTAKAGFLGRAALILYRPCARLRGWPVPRAVHTFHGHTFHGYWGPVRGRVFLGLERLLARLATWRIVAISPRQRREICHTYRVGRPEQFRVVPLGIDLEPFASPEEGRRRFRAELGAGEGEVLVGAVGRVAPVKNYGLFLEAAAELRARRPELFARCRFVVVGGGPAAEMEALAARVRELGLEGKALLAGGRADPEAFFPGLDALMLTSVNEGTPVSILEGGACGLPVAATAVGGVPDILGPEVRAGEGFAVRERGLTAASRDAAGLARGLAWLLDHPAEARRLGESLRDYVRSVHTTQRLCRDIAALYEEAAGRPPRLSPAPSARPGPGS